MSDLLTRMNNAVTRANMAASTTFDVLTGAVDGVIQVQGESIPTLSTRVRDYISIVVGDGSLNGVDGVGIAEMYVDQQGHLLVRLDNQQTPTDLGLVSPEDGDGVESVAYDEITGELTITLTTGQIIDLGNIAGEDAPRITDAYIEGANLKVETSDGTIFTAGDISQFGGISVNFVDLTEAGDLVVIFSDGTITTLGHVVGAKGETGRSVISGYINGAGDLVFLRNDGDQVNVGKVNVKIPDANSVVVESAKLGGVNGDELILTLTTGDVNVGKVVGEKGLDGIDGNGVDSVTLGSDGMLKFTMTDTSTTSVGPILNIDSTNGSIFLTSAEIDVDGNLSFEVDVNGVIETVNVGRAVGLDGKDGATIATAKVDPVTSELTFHDAEDVQLFNAGVIEQNSITTASIDPDTGHLILGLTDGTTVDGGSDLRGTDGLDGVGVTGAYIDAEGHLWFTFDEMPDADAGKVTAPVETDVVLVDDQLTITLSDGQVFGPFTVGGTDGNFVTSADIVNGELILQMSTGLPINAGSLEKNPTELSFGETGGLKVGFNDETFIETVERVKGIDGNTIDSVVVDDETHDLVFTVTTEDSTVTTEVRVPAQKGNSITALEVVGDELVITNDVTVEPLRMTIPKGVDGNSITDFTFVDGSLNIITSGAPDVPVVVPTVQGKTVESVSIEGDNLVFNVSTEEMPISFPTIRGVDAVESIRDISFNAGNGSLVITKVDDSEIVIENARGIDGITIDRIYIGLDKELIIETSDGGLFQFPYQEGRDGDSITAVELTPELELKITTVIEGVTSEVVIPAVHGIDGEDALTVLNGEVNATKQLVLTMSDDVTTHTIDGVGASVRDVVVNQVTGKLEITLDDETIITSDTSVRGRDGFGTGVAGVQYQGGNLVVTLKDVAGDETTHDAGLVEVVNITNAQMIDGDLILDFSDGRLPVNVGRIMGTDGRHVVSAEITPQQSLVLNMNNGDVIDAGSAKGADGRSITTLDVLATNDMVVNYDDDTVDVIGNIGGSDDLVLWESGVPYAKDRVVIYEGTLYLSQVNRNSSRPPHANWKAIAFGDYLTEIRTPVAISPIGGESGFNTKPPLTMSVYAPLVSSDVLDYREIQIYVSSPTALTYTAQHNGFDATIHEVETELAVNQVYKWRFRDIAVSGVMSEWSEVETFITPQLSLKSPTIRINENESTISAVSSPQFHTGPFDDSTGQVHRNTSWEVRLVSDDSVVYSKTNSGVLTTVIPYGTLTENTLYKIRAKHHGNSIASSWSVWLEFTTEITFNYVNAPMIKYLGDDPEIIDSFPQFRTISIQKTPHFAISGENIPMHVVGIEWEVVNADTGEIHETVIKDSTTDYETFTASNEWITNTNYRVRSRVNTSRFGISPWSPWFEGSALIYVEKPVVSTLEDPLQFPDRGELTITAYSAVNEVYVSTDWEVRDSNTEDILLSMKGVSGLMANALDFKVPASPTNQSLKVRVRYNSVNVSSEWSEYLHLEAQHAYTGPGPKTLIAGDLDLGFYGDLPTAELFPGMVGFPTLGTIISPAERWFKFSLQGHTIFVADRSTHNIGVTPSTSNSGNYYGTAGYGDGVITHPFSSYFNRGISVSYLNDKFKHRVLRKDDWDSVFTMISPNELEPVATYTMEEIGFTSSPTSLYSFRSGRSGQVNWWSAIGFGTQNNPIGYTSQRQTDYSMRIPTIRPTIWLEVEYKQ